MKFRKKPVVIDAVQWTGSFESLEEVLMFIQTEVSPGLDGKSFKIRTLEGWIDASIGDWIIRGVQGEYYPCKPDIFEKTYERVENDNDDR